MACDVGKRPRRGCRDFNFNAANLETMSAIAVTKRRSGSSRYKVQNILGGCREKAAYLVSLEEDEIWVLLLEGRLWAVSIRRRDCEISIVGWEAYRLWNANQRNPSWGNEFWKREKYSEPVRLHYSRES